MSEISRVEHLAYTYPGVEDTPGVAVFEDLNLTVEAGSFVAVLGGNGCGKSTLAKHFNSILLPSGGKVLRRFPARLGRRKCSPTFRKNRPWKKCGR